MLSVIFVPIISAVLLIFLFFLLKPTRKRDSLVMAKYHVHKSIQLMESSSALSDRDLKKLDILVARVANDLQTASFTDTFDLASAIENANSARKISSALKDANIENQDEYFQMLELKLLAISDYITIYCGITDDGKDYSIKLFSAKAKEDKAKSYLENLKK